jgi:hypothetical protein
LIESSAALPKSSIVAFPLGVLFPAAGPHSNMSPRQKKSNYMAVEVEEWHNKEYSRYILINHETEPVAIACGRFYTEEENCEFFYSHPAPIILRQAERADFLFFHKKEILPTTADIPRQKTVVNVNFNFKVEGVASGRLRALKVARAITFYESRPFALYVRVHVQK